MILFVTNEFDGVFGMLVVKVGERFGREGDWVFSIAFGVDVRCDGERTQRKRFRKTCD